MPNRHATTIAPAGPVSARARRFLSASSLSVALALAVLVSFVIQRPLAAGGARAPEGQHTSALAGLDASTGRAIEQAMDAAAREGVKLYVVSGWRSRAEQERLYAQAVAKYGSAQRAHRWVLRPSESAHVRGAAVDVGPAEGARWLDNNGARFGLCRRYDNEAWHFEVRRVGVDARCPRRAAHA